MNTFTFWQACEGTLAALRRSAASGVALTFRYGYLILVVGGISAAWFWRDKIPLTAQELAGYSAIIAAVALIIRLSNRHIRNSLEQAKASEKVLESERRTLEEHMKFRTDQLILTERERLYELKRTAQFGELSKGLFHDLMNPLSSLALYAERLEHSRSPDNSELIRRVINVSGRMRTYMESVRNCLSIEHKNQTADLGRELSIVRDVLSYKARMAGVEIQIEQSVPLELNIHPVKIYQIFLNLLTNAIEAFEQADKPQRFIRVQITKEISCISIKVQDNGQGMPAHVQSHIFNKAFTTKPGGTGIGLLTVHSIVTKDLGGSISVESELGQYTRFILNLPT